ncbi:heat shock factor protein 5-like [Protopterus annectens]|uniref:heat shock factor protein 5-like n=1 Tax=Protopterus annectens TaxID=7888 RepID=UPI001CFA6982|nr:heat shock factor protein 5-like [Protopterus annectens]
MEFESRLLATAINPSSFPAKLWRLVTNPQYQSIQWDINGLGIVIDQKLFQSELLCRSRYSEPTEQFKTSNFTSFVRQLNLYGFNKVAQGCENGHVNLCRGGPSGAKNCVCHHFHNMYFKKGHPELLINLKRLTKANREKLAQGREVNYRRTNRFQKLLSTSLEDAGKNEKPAKRDHHLYHSQRQGSAGPVNNGQIYSFSPYIYLSAPHGSFQIKDLDQTPVPSHPWQNSAGLMTGQMESYSLSGEGLSFPNTQHFPNDVPYTLQSNSTSVQVQKGYQGITASDQKFNSCVSSLPDYCHTYYPPVFQCCPLSTDMDSVKSHATSSSGSYTSCSCYQNEASQSSLSVELLLPNWQCSPTSENRDIDINLETVLQTADKSRSSPELEMVDGNANRNGIPTSPFDVSQLPSSPAHHGISASNTVGGQLKSLNPVVTESTSFVSDFNQQEGCCFSQNISYEYAVPASQKMENTTVTFSTYSATEHTTAQLQNKQLSRNISGTPEAILDQLLFKSEKLKSGSSDQVTTLQLVQVNEQMANLSSEGEVHETAFRSGASENKAFLTPEKYTEERDITQAESPDLHLLVNIACNQQHVFEKEECL